MTNLEIKSIITCIESCGQKVTPSLVYGMASILDTSVTLEQCKAALESPKVTVKDTLDVWQQQLRAKRAAESEAFSKLSKKDQEAYIAAWEEQQYITNI